MLMTGISFNGLKVKRLAKALVKTMYKRT